MLNTASAPLTLRKPFCGSTQSQWLASPTRKRIWRKQSPRAAALATKRKGECHLCTATESPMLFSD